MVNIEWNGYGWTQTHIPEKPTFSYAKKGNMPHDTLNFKFDKPVDTSETVHGFFQIRGHPREFVESNATNKLILRARARHKEISFA